MAHGHGTPRRRGRPPRALDEDALAEAAVSAFARDGFAGATLEDIALETGTERTLLYRRFGSKQAIHRWAVEREAETLMARLLAAYDLGGQGETEDALRAGFGALLDYSRERPSGFRLLFEPERGQGDAAAATQRIRGAVLARVEELVATRTPPALADAVDPAIVAAMIVGAAEGVARGCRAQAEADPEAVTEVLTTTFAAGLPALLAQAERAAVRRG